MTVSDAHRLVVRIRADFIDWTVAVLHAPHSGAPRGTQSNSVVEHNRPPAPIEECGRDGRRQRQSRFPRLRSGRDGGGSPKRKTKLESYFTES